MTKKTKALKRLKKLTTILRVIVAYPPKGHPRRSADGYPTELDYDEFAYRRIVDSFREGISEALKAIDAEN